MRAALLLASMAILATAGPACAQEMPDDFAYLADIDPTIQQDMRYATTNNFFGGAVPGYDAPECVLVREAAEGLKAVQDDLRGKGYTLKVYDCYRPARAVQAFVAWSKRPDDLEIKSIYYPALQKSALFPDYIALVSGHSRGATMDLTMVPLKAGDPSPTASREHGACNAAPDARASDGSIDMGTSFDCFDVKANTAAPGLTDKEKANRALLVEAMSRHGFQNYDKEWWHYTLKPEPYPDTIFDFPIAPRDHSSR